MAAFDLVNQIMTGLYWTAGALVFVIIGYFAYMFFTFKYPVRVRVVMKDRSYVVDDKARIVKRQGLKYWSLQKMRKMITAPPDEAKELSKRGKQLQECYYFGGDYFQWAKNDTPDLEHVLRVNPPKPIPNGKGQGLFVWITDTTKSSGKKPDKHVITQNQRTQYVQMYKDAEARKIKGLNELLHNLAPSLVILIIFIMALVFWKDVTAPSVQVAGQMQETAKKLDDTAGFLGNIILGEQVLSDQGGDPDAPEGTPPAPASPSGGGG